MHLASWPVELEVPKSPLRAREHCDHLVGAGEQRRRQFEAERPGSRDVDDEIELGGLHHRKIGRFGALENAGGIECLGTA